MIKPIIVIKLGGSSLQNPETVLQLATLVRGYQKRRSRVVLVHGGGPVINAELTRQNIDWEFINGQRRTTPQMIDVIDDVLAKKVNSQLVSDLRESGVAAVGLSGATSEILLCSQANKELMWVGKVEQVNTEGVKEILNQFGRKVPVIAPIGYGLQGERYNINADWAACQIAVALDAKKLIFLTDQDGILDKSKKLIARANPLMLNEMISEGTIHGGMYTKVKAMMTALEAGVKSVSVLSAGQAAKALFANAAGTLLTEYLSTHHSTKEVIHERAL